VRVSVSVIEREWKMCVFVCVCVRERDCVYVWVQWKAIIFVCWRCHFYSSFHLKIWVEERPPKNLSVAKTEINWWPRFFLVCLSPNTASVLSEQRHFLEIYGNVSYRFSDENECPSFFFSSFDKLSQLEVAIFSHCKLL